MFGRINLKEWFQKPASTIVELDAYNPPELTRGLMGQEQPVFIPPPQILYDLGSYRTPFKAVWRRPRNRLQGL